MRRFNGHKYTWSQPFTHVHHNWDLIGPKGALNFHASMPADGREEPSCGLEFHHTESLFYAPQDAPHHLNCPLTGGRCWHDGTSLYASENVWPMVKGYLVYGDHRKIFKLLEKEYDAHFSIYGDAPIEEPSSDGILF
jgi:hypothetical protein